MAPNEPGDTPQTVTDRTTDDKGRVTVDELTVTELMREVATNVRALLDLAASFVDSVEKNPLFSKMGAMFGKFGR